VLVYKTIAQQVDTADRYAPADFFVRWTLRADINYYTIQKKREL